MQRFSLGTVVATPALLERVNGNVLALCLARHVSGDWGDMPPEDVAANERALVDGTRLMSSYTSASGTEFWIITEADRSVTTILLPEDY